MTSVVTSVRQANSARSGSRLGLMLPIGGCAVLAATLPFGGLSAVTSTAPAVLLLILLYVPIVTVMARTEADVAVARAIWLGFAAKLVGFAARYLVITSAYERGDFTGYHAAGSTLAQSYRSGDFFVAVPGAARGSGTIALRVITGLIYTVTGSNLLIGSLAFSLLSFTGLVLCVKAFRLAVPQGDHPRFARLVLLVPSMLFWPSIIGKDAWMLFGLGLLAYGSARLYVRSPGGLLLMLVGAAASSLVRPHVALVALGAAVVGLVFRRGDQGPRRRRNLVAKLVLLVPLTIASFELVGTAGTFLQVDDLSAESLQATGADVGDRTGQGGSAFEPVAVDSATDLPLALLTVLFRPLPFEASNALSFGIALEGSILLIFTVLAWRRILGGLRVLARTPFLLLCGLYTLVFVAAFSNLANFGILARERVQVYPFFFAFLAAVPSTAVQRARARAAADRVASAGAERPLVRRP